MIEVRKIVKCFNGYAVLNDISFDIQQGEFVAIIGRSGSGKSTLLKCISGLLPPTSGCVLLDGKDIHNMTERDKSLFRNQMMGFVFQSYALEPKYTAYENIEIPMLLKGKTKINRKQRIEEISELVKIGHLLKKPAEQLSGGEKQRVAIARAIANKPQIIFADEPCGNLDKENSEHIIKLLTEINKEGTSIVMVTHQIEDINNADRIIELLDGRIINENA